MRSALRRLVGAVRHLLASLLGLLPGPPDGTDADASLLADIDPAPPEEQAARRQAWMQRFRRGRGDGAG